MLVIWRRVFGILEIAANIKIKVLVEVPCTCSVCMVRYFHSGYDRWVMACYLREAK